MAVAVPSQKDGDSPAERGWEGWLRGNQADGEGRGWVPPVCSQKQIVHAIDGWLHRMVAWMDVWMHGMDGWTHGWMHGCMVGGMVEGWRGGWMHECINAWMHGWKAVWMAEG